MSMRELGKRGAAKGSLIHPARQAMVAHLQTHGEVKTADLLQVLLDAGLVTESELGSHPYWLQNHLISLRIKGHVHSRVNADQQLVWAPGAAEQQAVDLVVHRSWIDDKVAKPRQINVMHGPVYEPAASAPTRPGALDFKRIKSLMGSRRVDYRGAP